MELVLSSDEPRSPQVGHLYRGPPFGERDVQRYWNNIEPDLRWWKHLGLYELRDYRLRVVRYRPMKQWNLHPLLWRTIINYGHHISSLDSVSSATKENSIRSPTQSLAIIIYQLLDIILRRFTGVGSSAESISIMRPRRLSYNLVVRTKEWIGLLIKDEQCHERWLAFCEWYGFTAQYFFPQVMGAGLSSLMHYLGWSLLRQARASQPSAPCSTSFSHIFNNVYPIRERLLHWMDTSCYSNVLEACGAALTTAEYDRHVLGLRTHEDRRRLKLLDVSPSASPGSAWASIPASNTPSEYDI